MHRPNVILLTIDTLRADRLGCYGHQQPLTPNLDRLAAAGIRFTSAITGGSWTQAAFPVLLTSSHAAMYGGCLGPLAPQRPSPVEALAACGYATGGFSSSPLLSKTYGYDRGFHDLIDLIPGERDPRLRRIRGGQRLLRRSLTHYAARLVGRRLRPARLYVSAAEVTDQVCRWIDGVQPPFFVWAHYMDVHWPYHREETLTHPAEIAQAWRDLAHLHTANRRGNQITPTQQARYMRLYDQALRYVDDQIGRLLAHLAQTERAANTIIVVVSDHGEEFLEHGRWGHWENNLHDEILKTPLIVHLPGHGRAQVVEHQVRTLDLMPTVLDLCGCPPPAGLEGTSLAPLWTGRAEAYAPTVAISEMWRDPWHIIAVRTAAFKLIWDSKQPDRPVLFDLRADPGEQHNAIAQHPEAAEALLAHVHAHRQRAAQTSPQAKIAAPELDEAVISRLRGLGYVD